MYKIYWNNESIALSNELTKTKKIKIVSIFSILLTTTTQSTNIYTPSFDNNIKKC